MADAIHDSGGPERNPEHLHAPDKRPDEKAEQIGVNRQHHENAQPVQTAEEVTLDPVVRRSFAIFLEHSRLADGSPVVERTLEHNVAKPLEEWAMWIAVPIRECMMFSMTGNPFLRDDRSGEPQPEPHRKRREIMQAHAAVGLRPMKEQGHADVGDMPRDQDEQNRSPPTSGPQPETWHFLTPNQRSPRHAERKSDRPEPVPALHGDSTHRADNLET